MEKANIVYIAAVLDNADILQGIHEVRYAHHVTLRYGGISQLPSFIGRSIEMTMLEYFCDDKADCIKVSIKDPDIAQYSMSSGQVPHVTLTCAKGIRPVYSNTLMKNGLGKPIVGRITGTIRAFVSDTNGNIHTV